MRVGTDCSGIEAPIEALKQLKIPFIHVFSSEIDKHCIKSIKANYTPQIIFGDKEGDFPEGDITKRNIKDVPDIDLYVCGFPCQPFSTAGQRKGFKDKRGNVFWSCLEVIKTKQPKYFILENVKGLLNHDKGNTWKVIWEELKRLEKYGYYVDWKVLNTRDYGIPQNRERVFIVGVKGKKFEWPKKKKMGNIKEYVDNTDKNKHKTSERLLKILANIPENKIFVEIGFGSVNERTFPNAHLFSSCLIAQGRLWCYPNHRYANHKELLMLQGFSKNLIHDVSDTQFKKQIGNSMSVNVVKSIIQQLL